MTTWSDPIATRSIVRLQVAHSRSARRFDEGQVFICDGGESFAGFLVPERMEHRHGVAELLLN